MISKLISQIIELCELKGEELKKAQKIIENFANRGLRSLGVARQVKLLYLLLLHNYILARTVNRNNYVYVYAQSIPEKTKESSGGAWEFVGLLPLFDPPRHDSAETIKRALDLGVSVKMITGDQLAIGKETGRRLGMGTNMYPSSSLLGQNNHECGTGTGTGASVDELIEKADGFAGVFPGN